MSVIQIKRWSGIIKIYSYFNFYFILKITYYSNKGGGGEHNNNEQRHHQQHQYHQPAGLRGIHDGGDDAGDIHDDGNDHL